MNKNSPRRTKALTALASRLQMKFDPDFVTKLYGPPALLGRGGARGRWDLMSGTVDGVFVEVFEYQFKDWVSGTSGRYGHHHQGSWDPNLVDRPDFGCRQTVILLHHDNIHLPRFELSPEKLRHKLAALVGFNDIDFENDDEFSARFLLKSPEEDATRLLFDRSLRHTMTKMDDDICIDADHLVVAVYRLEHTIPLDEVESKMHEAIEIAQAFWERAREAFGVLDEVPDLLDEEANGLSKAGDDAV